MGANGENLFTQTNNLIYPYPVVNRSIALGSVAFDPATPATMQTTSTSSALILLNGDTGMISGGDLTLGLNDASALITTKDTEDLTIDPAGTGTIYFHGVVYNIDSGGILTTQKFIDSAGAGAYYLDPAEGTTSLAVAGAITTGGNITVGGGTGKITVGEIDPPYTIDDQKYATFLTAMTGLKEETTGVVTTSELVPGVGYRSIIDFGNQPVGSDIWLFSKTTDLKTNINNLVVLLDPSGNVRVWYDLDIPNFKLAIYSSLPSRISYRLTAPRFDTANRTNTRDSGPTGYNLTPLITPIPVTGPIATPSADGLADITITTASSASGVLYQVQNSLAQLIYNVGIFSQAAIANLTAGVVDAQKVVSPVAEVGEVKTNVISPLSSDSVEVKLGSTQTFSITNTVGSPSATFDSIGNATIAGTLQTNALVVKQTTTFEGDISQTGGINGIPDQESMVANAGFELAQVNPSMPDAWNCTNTGAGTGTCSRDTVNFVQGSAAIAVNKTNASGTLQFTSTCFPVTAGATYNVNAMARGSVTLNAGTFKLGLWDFATKSDCESFTNGTAQMTNRNINTTYAVKATTQTIDVGAGWARAGGIVDGLAATAYIDSFRVTPQAVTSAVDIAENYFASAPMPVGTVVSISPTNDSAVEKAATSSAIIGIVSTNPALTLGSGIADESMLTPVALSGRVPAIVSNENGAIANGDAITSSAIPGVGTKAVNAGMTVGKALEPFAPTSASWRTACPAATSSDSIVWPADDGTNTAKPCFKLPDGTYIGKIMTFINVTWFAPAVTAELRTDTLYADRIISKFGSFDELKTTTASATYITNIMNIFNATPSSGLISPLPDATGSAIFDLGVTPDATMSANIQIDKDVTITSSLGVLGATTLGATSISDSLMVDGSLLLTSSRIESAGDTLYLNKGKLADVNIMDGAIVVDTHGNVALAGDLIVAGTIATNTISPLGDGNVTVNLAQYQPASTESGHLARTFGQLIVAGAGNMPVVAFDSGGNATLSGSLMTSKLYIADASPVGATESGTLTGNETIGKATLRAYQTQVTISTTKVTSNSFIYLTPVTDPNNHVLYVVSKTPGVGFTIGINNSWNQNMDFNWWLVN
jgi:hypothetical protein